VHDVIVLGAGIAGLSCARRLRDAGADVLVLDRADKPGGRCATRWHDGVPFDYGPLFVHGSDPGFMEAVSGAAADGVLKGWPLRISGRGTPCQPEAFSRDQGRFAFARGMTVFPRMLAQGLDIRLGTLVTGLQAGDGAVTAHTSGGETYQARDAVIAFALEQSASILRTVGQDGAPAVALLGMFNSVPCSTAVVGYPRGVPVPEWDILYPERDPALLLVGNETAKRAADGKLVLVLQGGPRWSQQNLEKPKEAWLKDLLSRAAALLGPWAASPEWFHLHRWRYARVDQGNELAAPAVFTLGRSRLGLAGDLFAPGGGMQAAWLSGRRLAEMLRS
jgi:renalase